MQAVATTKPVSTASTRSSSRLNPLAVVVFVGSLLAIELLAEWFLAGRAPVARAVTRWGLLLLTIVPVYCLLVRRGYRTDEQIAVGVERDQIRALARALAEEESPENLMSLIVRQARELSGARTAFLARLDGNAFRIEAAIGGTADRLIGQYLPITAGAVGIAGQALRQGRAVTLSDTWSDTGLASRRELALSDRVRSAAAVPLMVRGELLGLLGLHADAVDRLGAAQTATLDLYAEQAAAALEKALLADSVQRIDAAERLDQLKSEFLSAVAHELRTPLSPMLGWSELLLAREYTPAQARPMLENIHEGAQHLSVLVGDLLDLSRGEAGRLALDVTDLDLNDLLEASVARWREQAPGHTFMLASAGTLPLRGDRNRLRQVLDNLLSNASKYSPPGSRVIITARVDGGGRVVVRVSDQGLGLSAEEQKQLFSKFYRTDAAREQASGTGLGLALCRLILRAHGGDIEVESEGSGLGSAFTFTLLSTGPATQTRQAGAAFAPISA